MKKILSILFLSMFLTACMNKQWSDPSFFKSPPPAYLAQTHFLKALKNWEIRGALAVKEKKAGWQARLIWHETPDRFSGRIYAYLTTEQLLVSGTSKEVLVKDNQGHTYKGKNLAPLIQSSTGWLIPLDALRYWVKGLHQPELSYCANYDSEGHLKLLKQAGWKIVYKNYETISGYVLPRQIDLFKEDLKIKLRVTKWLF